MRDLRVSAYIDELGGLGMIRLNLLRAVLAAAAENDVPAGGDLTEARHGEFSRLMSRVSDKASRVEFVRQGIGHPQRLLRWEAYGWINTLPPAEQRKAAEQKRLQRA